MENVDKKKWALLKETKNSLNELVVQRDLLTKKIKEQRAKVASLKSELEK